MRTKQTGAEKADTANGHGFEVLIIMITMISLDAMMITMVPMMTMTPWWQNDPKQGMLGPYGLSPVDMDPMDFDLMDLDQSTR